MEHLEFGGLDSYMRNKTTNGCNNGQLVPFYFLCDYYRHYYLYSFMIIFYIILVYETFYCIILFFCFPILIKKWDYVEL